MKYIAIFETDGQQTGRAAVMVPTDTGTTEQLLVDLIEVPKLKTLIKKEAGGKLDDYIYNMGYNECLKDIGIIKGD